MYRTPLPLNVPIKISKPTGEYAHENFEHQKYAIDFIVPVGTEVLASRDGVVIKIKQDSDKYGIDKKFADEVNYVATKHDDGTHAEYLHLGKNKVEVGKGDNVKWGYLLGYTGLSGIMSDPRLHFNVFKINEGRAISVPVKFDE